MIDFRLPFDEPIFRAVNGLGWDWLDQVWILASEKSFGLAMAIGIGIWVVASFRRKAIRPVLQVATTILIVDRVGHEWVKPLVSRLRPCFALPASEVRLLVDIASQSPSMPSLHAANSCAFAVALLLCLPGSGRYAIPIAVLISLSRIGVGVHWPSDILAGALFGALVAIAVHAVFQKILPMTQAQPGIE